MSDTESERVAELIRQAGAAADREARWTTYPGTD